MGSTNKPNPSNSYIKYSNLALQLLLGIGLAGWLGYTLDQYLSITFPAFMLTFGFLAFGGMLYQIYRSLNKDWSVPIYPVAGFCYRLDTNGQCICDSKCVEAFLLFGNNLIAIR